MIGWRTHETPVVVSGAFEEPVMGSKLVGLKKTLSWDNFQKKTENPPAPGLLVPGAQTNVTVSLSHKIAPTTKSGAGHTLADSLTFTITFDPTNWVKTWVLKKPANEQADLLKHEQGHYDIAALIARDYFIDIMDMKNWEYTTTADVDSEYQQLKTEMRTKTAAAEKLYEDETKNGTVKSQHASWNGFIQKSFTELRAGGGQAPDGTQYKKPLLEVLRAAGKNI
jgi:hypothetical protein